jgi:hypothetical protein
LFKAAAVDDRPLFASTMYAKVLEKLQLFHNMLKRFLSIRKNLQQEELAQKEKYTDSRNMYMLRTYPSESKSARGKTTDAKEGTP